MGTQLGSAAAADPWASVQNLVDAQRHFHFHSLPLIMEDRAHKAHRPSQSGAKAEKKKEKGKGKEKQQGFNEKVRGYAHKN